MGSLSVLSFLWLSFSTYSLVHCETSTTPSSPDGRPLAELTRIGTPTRDDDEGAAVVAQLVRDQSAMNAKQQDMEVTLEAAKKELEATKTKLEATLSTLENTQTELQTFKADVSSGSSFVHWGRKTCPSSTTLVYTGVAGGKQYNQKGSGTNPLCLTRTPQFDNTTKPAYHAELYGAEYEAIHGHMDHDVPCSVCLAPQSTTIMVPATHTCPPGWTPHYTGHLTSSSTFHTHYATEYVCLDGSPEDDAGGVRNQNGLVFFYVVTVCGSLPCPPYINNKVVTCVVCSK